MINILAVFDPVSFFIYMAISMAISYAIAMLTQKKPKIENAKPESIDIPTIEEGVIYPVVFGTPKRIEGYVIAWWGDVKTTPIIKKFKQDGLFGSKTIKQTVGYHYSAGMHLKLCHGPIDGIKQIYVGDKLAWPDPDDEDELAADGVASININQPDIFGGEDSEGGIVGDIDIQYGSSAQTVNSYLSGQLGSDISASRGLIGAILKCVRFGTSPYPKPWAFLCKRTQILDDGMPQWYLAKADISGDMNPIHILRECYTNSRWGLNHSTGLIDDESWETAADTLYAEGFGLSYLWDGNTEIQEFINDILRHINAVIYQSPETGRFIIKLIRNDYDIEDLETFDDSDIISVEDYTRPSLGAIPDVIFVRYQNILTNKNESFPDHDIALMDAQGGRSISLNLDYMAVTNKTLAGKIAARERQHITAMLVIMTIKAKRTMAHLRPGDVFILQWPILGITQMVLRVASVNYGSLVDGTITLKCAEDIFGMQDAIYSVPPASGWTNPISEPQTCSVRTLIEVPFYTIANDLGLSMAQQLNTGAGYLAVGAIRPTSDSYDYELLLRDSPTSDFVSAGRGDFTPTATLISSLPKNAVNATIELENIKDLDLVEVGSYAIIENEIVSILDVDTANNEITIGRGVLDTVPASHSADSRIWFIETICFLVSKEYASAAEPGTKVLPRTGKGQLDAASAPIDNASAFNSRQVRPYPPGNFKINTVSYPSSFTGQPTLTWAHRDRLQQTSSIVEHSAASIGPEAGTTYSIKIYDEDNVLVRTVTGITGINFEYTEVMELADCGELQDQLRFELWSVRDSFDSWQKYDITVARA